jgi:hypothetical protein
MMGSWITDIEARPMGYGNRLINIFYNFHRLLASCKLELKNEAIIKSGNLTMNVKIKNNKNESCE